MSARERTVSVPRPRARRDPAAGAPMNVAFLLGTFPALSETFVLDQITGLVERGHAVSIFAERRPPAGAAEHPDVARFDLRRRTRYEQLPPRFVGRLARLPAVWRPRAPFVRALNVLRYGGAAASLRLVWGAALLDGGDDGTGDYDVVHCHFGALGLKAVLLRELGALRGRPRIVTTFHGEDVVNYPRRFRGNVYAPLFARGDLFLPVSARWNDALVAAGCPPERIRVHRMGVDLRRFGGGRRRPPLPDAADRPLRLLTVARLVEKKGIGDAIRAVARARAASVPCEYVIAGDGPLRRQLEETARTEGVGGVVRFAGACTRAEVVRLLDAADVFVAPSVTAADGDVEGIPVSLMEAMASRLPVVSTRHSAIPELVADGVSGFLVAERDVDALAARLATLAADPGLRARMGDAGRAAVARDFDAAALTADLEGLYRDLLA